MVNKVSLFLLLFLSGSLFGVIQRIDADVVQKIKLDLKELNKSTKRGKQCPRLSLERFRDTMFVAEMRTDRSLWFTFQTQDDAQALVNMLNEYDEEAEISWSYYSNDYLSYRRRTPGMGLHK